MFRSEIVMFLTSYRHQLPHSGTMTLRSLKPLRAFSRNLSLQCSRAYAASSHSIHTPSSTPAPAPEQAKDNLHYHAFPNPPPGRFALSFLPDPPSFVNSRTVIGFLPLSQERVGLDDFRENPGFRFVTFTHPTDIKGHSTFHHQVRTREERK